MTYQNAHAAHINEENIVDDIIVIPYLDDDDEKITAYCNSLGLEGKWIDTSYLGSRRGKYAAIGDKYDPELDIFISYSSEHQQWISNT